MAVSTARDAGEVWAYRRQPPLEKLAHKRISISQGRTARAGTALGPAAVTLFNRGQQRSWRFKTRSSPSELSRRIGVDEDVWLSQHSSNKRHAKMAQMEFVPMDHKLTCQYLFARGVGLARLRRGGETGGGRSPPYSLLLPAGPLKVA